MERRRAAAIDAARRLISLSMRSRPEDHRRADVAWPRNDNAPMDGALGDTMRHYSEETQGAKACTGG